MLILGDVTQFSTSGLVAQKNDWTPKPSWYYVYTMKNTLANMVFLGEQTSTDPNILIYKFKNVTSSEGAHVVWAKAKQNYTVSNYMLNLTGTPTSATRVDMVNGDNHYRWSCFCKRERATSIYFAITSLK